MELGDDNIDLVDMFLISKIDFQFFRLCFAVVYPRALAFFKV